MGWRDWFTWSSSSKSMGDPPARQDRQKCWDSRDAYYACLDASNVLKPGEEGTACSRQLKEYEKNCAKSWVCLLHHRVKQSLRISYRLRLTISTSEEYSLSNKRNHWQWPERRPKKRSGRGERERMVFFHQHCTYIFALTCQ
jgi:cytochrome c oxidase assembly factor 6